MYDGSDESRRKAGESWRKGNVMEATERFADADPEYAHDAVDDIDVEEIDVEPRDSKDGLKDKGDIGSAEPGMDPR
jgi:hypothetical protein